MSAESALPAIETRRRAARRCRGRETPSSTPSSTTCSTSRASSRRSPRRTTTTRRWPTRCATACCSAGSAPRRPTRSKGSRTVAYLSAEFLIGPHLGNNLINLGIYDAGARRRSASWASTSTSCSRRRRSPASATAASGGSPPASSIRWRRSRSRRSATASATSSASSTRRSSTAGRSRRTDKWLRFGNPWEIARPEWAVEVKLRRPHRAVTATSTAACACAGCRHKVVMGIPYDTPILGYRNNTANTLRLWKAEAPESFDFAVFNRGDYYGAVNQKVASENLTKVLYPNDEQSQGKELRLEQQYFFVSLLAAGHAAHPAARRSCRVERFHEKFAIQLNDTHPAIAVAELMRLLVDEHAMPWDEAWAITHAHVRLHQPHAAARGAGALAARPVPARAAAAPRDHLRDQRALPRRGAHPLPRRRGAARAAVADRRARRALRAHGAPRLRRQPRDQRRGRAALASC